MLGDVSFLLKIPQIRGFKLPWVVLFNRQGSLIKKHKFHFKQKDIEIVREYKYLGFIFACSCSTTTGITNLINQAKKAWFTIRLYLSSSKNKKIETYLKLYDTQIKPILLYACEAWADSIKTSKHRESLKETTYQTSLNPTIVILYL